MRHVRLGLLLLAVLGLGVLFNSSAVVHSSNHKQSPGIEAVLPEKHAPGETTDRREKFCGLRSSQRNENSVEGFRTLTGVTGHLPGDSQSWISNMMMKRGVTSSSAIVGSPRKINGAQATSPNNTAQTFTVTVGPGFSTIFSPETLNIRVGDTVHWIWATGTHSVTSGTCNPACTADGNFDSSILGPPSTFDVTFNQADSFPYFCVVHGSNMIGTINVDTCTPPPPGMVAWWPGEGNGNDIRGSNPLIQTFGTPQVVPAKVEQGMKFDGVSGFAAPDDPALNFGSGSFSIDLWVRIDASPGPNGAVLVEKRNSAGVGYVLSTDGTALFFTVRGDGGAVGVQTPAIPAGFHHIAVSVDRVTSNNVTIYLDGVAQPSLGVAGIGNTNNAGRLFVGQNSLDSGTSAGPFNGVIDELELFNRELAVIEIQNIVNAGSKGKCRPRCSAAPSGMVSWWDADDDPFDRQGTNHGTMPLAGAGFGTGKVGRAFTFDGSQNPVSIPDNASLDLDTFTIDAWVFPTGLDGAEDIIVNKEIVGTTQYEMGIKGSINTGGSIPLGNLTVFIGGVNGLPNEDVGWVNGGGPLPLNTWSHVAMTFDGSTLRAFINGVLTRQVTGLAGTPPSTNGPFRIGARNPNLGFQTDPFNGSIDEVEVFDRALSASEIQAINNAGFAGKCKLCLAPPTNMIGWWAGDGDANDVAGGGNDGTLEGGASFAFGKVGQSFSFNGTDAAVVAAPASATVMNQLPLTVDAWVRPALRAGSVDDFFPNNAVSNDLAGFFGHGFGVNVMSDGSKMTIEYQDGFRDIFPEVPFNADQWYHIATVYTDGNVKSYVDGLLVDNLNYEQGELDSTAPVSIGKHNDDDLTYGTRRFFKGLIDEVEVFNRALTQTEIQSIVAAGASGKCKRVTTSTGSNVSNQVGDTTLTFGNVSNGGITTYQTLDTYQPGPMPFGYDNPIHVAAISTAATFTGGVRTCFNLQAVNDVATFLQLRILHQEGNDLVNRTSFAQFSTRTLCADLSSFSPLVIAQNTNASPTAAPASIGGRITTPDGSPLGGAVMHLSGAATRATVTDGAGNYHFDDLATESFYAVTPSLVNYHFSPTSRSFSLVGNITDAAFTANADASPSANAIDTTEYFVRQQYLDFLGREPDQGGLEYWSAQINQCNGDAACISQKRIDVSAAFFASAEFQQTGSYIYGLYAGTLGRAPGYGEFMPDRAQVLGGSGLDQAKTAFAQAFVQRPEFTNRYPQSMTREQFVDAVIQTMTTRSGVDQSSLRNQFLGDYDSGGRALVVRHASEASSFAAAEYNKAFVLMEYFGYLRREIDQGGYDYWLDVLNHGAAGNYRGMVCAFLTSTEYQLRFSTVVTHSNAECGP
jgi:plastocyanin